MTITMQSSIENDPAVAAALGDLAKTPSTEEKTEVSANPEGTQEGEEQVSEPTEGEESGEGVEASEESDEENETEELEASGEDSEETEAKEQKTKKKNGFKKRIDKLNGKITAAEQRALFAEQQAEHWRQEALRAKGQGPAKEPEKSAPTKSEPNARPKAENFETHEAFIEALTDWKYDQRKLADEAKQKETQIKTEYQKKISTHQERVQKFAEAHDDFNEVVNSVQVPLPLGVQQAIVESDLGPELMYALAKDQKELQRICSLPVLQAAKEIGKLESRLSPASETSEKKTTKAPAPVNPVRTKGTKVTKSPETMTQREFESWRMEQEKARRQAGF